MADSTGGHQYKTTSWLKHITAKYTGLSFLELGEMEYVQYLTMRRDAYITHLNQTEEGRKYLANAWRMEQTEPDRAGLRAKLGRKEATTDGI